MQLQQCTRGGCLAPLYASLGFLCKWGIKWGPKQVIPHPHERGVKTTPLEP